MACTTFKFHLAHSALVHLANGRLGEMISRLLGVDDIREYDSVQFPSRSIPSWHGSLHTEIVMLKWHAEPDYLSQHLTETGLRCGPPSGLRPCRPHDPAIQQQGAGVCDATHGAPLNGAALRLAREANCL